MRKLIYTCFLACATWLAPGALLAQEPQWPAKPLRIIVPGGTGGVLDIRARWLAPRLAVALGQAVTVENKAGAGGNIGTEMAARAPERTTATSCATTWTAWTGMSKSRSFYPTHPTSIRSNI